MIRGGIIGEDANGGENTESGRVYRFGAVSSVRRRRRYCGGGTKRWQFQVLALVRSIRQIPGGFEVEGKGG